MRSPSPIRAALTLATLLLAGCSSGAVYVDREYSEPHIQKPPVAGWNGTVQVCHGTDTPSAQVEAMAKEACAYWGLETKLQKVQRWQCSFTAPHRTTYTCIDPEMRFADGSYVNPFEKSSVERWRDEKVNGPEVHGRKARAERAAKLRAAREQQEQRQ